MVAFNARNVPRNATDKMSPARFPTPSVTAILKEPRKGAPRTLGRQKVPRDQRLRKCLLICGPSKFAAQARSAWRPTPRNNRCRGQPPARQLVRYLKKGINRTKALHGPRTQAYGETKYLDKKRFEFRKMGYLIKTSSHFVHGLNTIKG